MKIKRWMVMDVNPEAGQVKDVENKIIETRGMIFYRKINSESYLISMTDPVRKVFGEEFGGVVDGIHLYLDLEEMNKFFKDFKNSLDHYDDDVVRPGITGEYNAHPKEIAKIMIDKL